MALQCKRCKKPRDEESVTAYIEDYISHIPDAEQTDVDTYNRRKSICMTCTYSAQDICGICGCYISIRAYRKHMTCPHPERDRWA